jgi:uncharacterized membrane protein SpoIIM required for sporulation
MVLETLMSVRDVVKNPWHMLVFGFVITLVCMGISYLVFPQNAGLLMVFLITIISAPFMMNLMKYGEYREEKNVSKINLLERLNPISAFFRQQEVFFVYSAFFGGIVIALAIAYAMLPVDFVERAFNDQINQISRINSLMGMVVGSEVFGQILFNNMIVVLVSFVFALLFGIGAIFILAWNASVLGAAIGIISKSYGLPSAMIAFLPYGIFEIGAYFIAAIAGGIISVLVSKRKTIGWSKIVEDMLILMVFAFALVFIGAYIESQAFM